MINRWTATKEQKEKIIPMIKIFLTKLERMTQEEIEAASKDTFMLDLYNVGAGPNVIKEILENDFGYEVYASDYNGWEMDFWISFQSKEDRSFPYNQDLVLRGCGMNFDLKLYVEVD